MLCKRHARTMLTALHHLRAHVEKMDRSHPVQEAQIQIKLQEIDELFEYIQSGTDINFQEMIDKCMGRKSRKKKEEYVVEGMEWLGGNKDG